MDRLKEQAPILQLLYFFPLLLLLSCSSVTHDTIRPDQAPAWLKEDQRPKRVVILPFENRTGKEGLDEEVRKSFYSHFSTKNFYDVELGTVDAGLRILKENTSRSWQDLPPSSIGNLFHADFVIYGKVLTYEEIFAGIYSQIALEVEVEMVSSRTNEDVWQKTLIKRSHEGGVPLSVIGIPFAAARSGYHLRDVNTITLIDSTCRELVEQMPEPQSPSPSPFLVDIQVASFLERERALQVLHGLQRKGLSPRLEAVTLGDRRWHRILLGPYRDVSEANKVRDTVAGGSSFHPILVNHWRNP